MPVTSIEQPTYLILDNCVLVMLTDLYCTENSAVPARKLLDDVQAWLLEQLALLRNFAIENTLHSTALVSEEYLPHTGILGQRGLLPPQLNALAQVIRRQFTVFDGDIGEIRALRNLPKSDKYLVGKDGLSDQDLSLVHYGLNLTQFGQPVLIISNDQDLLLFISWVRTQTCLRSNTCTPQLLEGLTCLTYFDLIHRGCSISSDQMTSMINYMIIDTVMRMNRGDELALNPAKGQKIISQITRLNQEFTKSVAIKAHQQGAQA